MSVGTGRQNMLILVFLKITVHFWEYINGNQTFILNSHRPFICSVPIAHLRGMDKLTVHMQGE
jgi:hypothetical protein